MQGNFLVEFFDRKFVFLSKTMVKKQKYEYDYMSLDNNSLVIPGAFKVYKNNYIRIMSDDGEFQGIITAVENKTKETKIQYKALLSILDVDVYKDRTALKGMTVESFIGEMIEENFVTNEDELQNIPGFIIEKTSETSNGALNLKDDIHNIYDLIISAFRKYEIVVDMKLDLMNKCLKCTIGKRSFGQKTIEGDLKNVLEVNITKKDDSKSVNKAVIIGFYSEESELFGQTVVRNFYLDKKTGEITKTPSLRATPVVFRHKIIEVKEETFEEDAYQEAYDIIYQEKYDNEIKVKFTKSDSLHKVDDFGIGQTCIVIKNGILYETVFTGYVMDEVITLIFGMIRVEYTKNLRRK